MGLRSKLSDYLRDCKTTADYAGAVAELEARAAAIGREFESIDAARDRLLLEGGPSELQELESRERSLETELRQVNARTVVLREKAEAARAAEQATRCEEIRAEAVKTYQVFLSAWQNAVAAYGAVNAMRARLSEETTPQLVRHYPAAPGQLQSKELLERQREALTAFASIAARADEPKSTGVEVELLRDRDGEGAASMRLPRPLADYGIGERFVLSEDFARQWAARGVVEIVGRPQC